MNSDFSIQKKNLKNEKGDTCQTDVYVLNLLLCQQLQLLPQLMFVQKDLHFG